MSERLILNGTEVIVIRETRGESFIRDLFAVASFFVLIGLGVIINSGLMQFIGALLAGFSVYAGIKKLVADNRMTVEQARKRLDEIEAAK